MLWGVIMIAKNKRLLGAILISVIMMVMSVVGMTFSYFSSKTNGGSNNLSFGVLSTQVSLNNSSFSDNPKINITNLTAGKPVVSEVKVKTIGNVNGFMRVKVRYEGDEENTLSQAVAVALNTEEGIDGYDTYNGDSNYGWSFVGGYYYLINKADSGNLLTASSSNEYVLFRESSNKSTVYFPDISKYNLASTSLEDVEFNITVEAVQSAHTNVNTATELEELIEHNNIFNQEIETVFLVQYNTMCGTNVTTSVITPSTQSIELPSVGTTAVDWYKTIQNGIYSELVGHSGTTIQRSSITGNTTLYARYSDTKIAVIFEDNILSSGTLPSVQYVTYASSGSEELTVGQKLTRLGYDYTGWTDGTNTFNITNGKID